jgi:hypothetical protein
VGECTRQHLVAVVAHGVAVPEREGELQGVPVRAPRAAPGGRGGHRASQVVGGGGGGGGRGGGGQVLVQVVEDLKSHSGGVTDDD